MTAPTHATTSRNAGSPSGGVVAASTGLSVASSLPSPPEYASSQTDRYRTSLAADAGGKSGNASVAYSGHRGRAHRAWSKGARGMPSKASTAAVAMRAR